MYIAPRQGQTPLRGQNLDVNRNILSLRSFVTSLKKISLKSDFFNDFIHVYSPRVRADNPLGITFLCQQKGLITLPICSLKSDFIHIVSCFYTVMYMAPGQGQTTPWEQNFDVNRKALSLLIWC